MVLVEAPYLGIEVAGLLPRFGHEHRGGVADVAPAAHQQLRGLVELGRVGAGVVEHGMKERFGAEVRLVGRQESAGAHAVLVALDGVDLTVVAEQAERLGPFPGRQRVGREPLVEDGEGCREPFVGQVEVVAASGGRRRPIPCRRSCGTSTRPRTRRWWRARYGAEGDRPRLRPFHRSGSRKTTCSISGQVRTARSPSTRSSTGGMRHSTSSRSSAASASSTPGRGSSPRTNNTATPCWSPKIGAGIGARNPQPSDVRASAARAPRCFTQASPLRAISTIDREDRPSTSATNPMPQASSSRMGASFARDKPSREVACRTIGDVFASASLRR